MLGITDNMIKTLEYHFGKDFVLGIDSSGNEHGVYGGMSTYIDLYSNRVSSPQSYLVNGVPVFAYPMPGEDIEIAYGHVLSLESIFVLAVKRDRFVTGETWDMLTEVVEFWGVEKTKIVLSKLPKDLYDLNAKDFIEHFDSESYGA